MLQRHLVEIGNKEMRFGGLVPEEYYLSHRPPLLLSDPGVESVYIAAKSVYNHPLVVHTSNSRLHIELRSEGGSINTTVLFRELGPNPKDPDIPPSNVYLDEHNESHKVRLVSPCVKLQLHMSPVDVYCNAPWPGICKYNASNCLDYNR
ncbi:CRAL-TRIO domain-containing protein [Trichonephila clavipes]|nr:CRAL-TRIO domain-containing protein [Trichonephila clavipes]